MKKIISSPNAPKAIGPYSQAVVHGEYIFCSGMLALNPETMEMVGQSTGEQTLKIMENLSAVLKEAGSDLGNVLKTTIYLKNMDDFNDMNEVYKTFFPSNPPARATVEVSRLPKNALVEIDCIAYLDTAKR